jgi:hypothetical protein
LKLVINAQPLNDLQSINLKVFTAGKSFKGSAKQLLITDDDD